MGCLILLDKCLRCHRKIKSLKSMELGYGPTCAKLAGVITKRVSGVPYHPSHIIDEFLEKGEVNENSNSQEDVGGKKSTASRGTKTVDRKNRFK